VQNQYGVVLGKAAFKGAGGANNEPNTFGGVLPLICWVYYSHHLKGILGITKAHCPARVPRPMRH